MSAVKILARDAVVAVMMTRILAHGPLTLVLWRPTILTAAHRPTQAVLHFHHRCPTAALENQNAAAVNPQAVVQDVNSFLS